MESFIGYNKNTDIDVLEVLKTSKIENIENVNLKLKGDILISSDICNIFKYITNEYDIAKIEINDGEYHINVININDINSLINIIPNNIKSYGILRYFIKFYKIDDILKFYKKISPLKIYQLVLYSLIYRTDIFYFFIKNNPNVINMLYKSLGYDFDEKKFSRLNILISVFNLFVYRASSIDDAYSNINCLLNNVNCSIDDYLTIDNFIKYDDNHYFIKLLKYKSTHTLYKYIKELKKKNKDINYSLIIDILKEKQIDDKYLDLIYSALLSEAMYNTDNKNMNELLKAHSLMKKPIVIDNDMLQMLSLSKYYAKIINEYICIINDNIGIENLLYSFIISSISNNITFCRIIYKKIDFIYNSASEDVKNKILFFTSLVKKHFKNNGLKGVDEIFKIK